MKTRRLIDGDYSFGSGQADFIEGLEALKQSCLTRLRQFKGGWFLNEEDGTDWEKVLANQYQQSVLINLIKQKLLTVLGVNSVPVLNVEFDNQSRYANIEATINTIYGEFNLSESLGLFQ